MHKLRSISAGGIGFIGFICISAVSIPYAFIFIVHLLFTICYVFDAY